MKYKARSPFYHTTLGLVKKGQEFESKEDLSEYADKIEEPKKKKKKS